MFEPYTVLFMHDSARSELVTLEVPPVVSIQFWHMEHPNSIALRSYLQIDPDSVVYIVISMAIVPEESCSCSLTCAWLIASIAMLFFWLQADVVNEVEVGASRKVFDLRLGGLGPYNIDFSRSGGYMLIGGKKGHLGLIDWQSGRTFCEVQVSKFFDPFTCVVIVYLANLSSLGIAVAVSQ